jgi:integrase
MRLIPLDGKENANLYRHPKTGVIYFKMYRHGKGQIEKSTRTSITKDARRKKDELLQEWLGLKPKNRTLKLVSELWNEFVDTKTDKSDGTKESITYSGKHLLGFFESYLPQEITPALWERYIVLKRDESPKRRFFNEWKWFNMFTLFLRDHGYLDVRPKLRNPDPRKKEVGKVFSSEEIKKLLLCATGDLKLQILMGLTMGMRIGEILGLSWDRVDFKKKTIHLRAEDTKIRRARTFGISEPVLEILSERDVTGDWVFPSPTDEFKPVGKGGNKRAWATCKRNAKVTGRFHDLRHTFLTNAFRNAKGKIDSMLICEYAGLSIEMAQDTYLHFNEEDTRAVTKLVKL